MNKLNHIEMPRRNMKSSIFAELIKKVDEIIEENKQLKELLKETKIYVENFIEGSTTINDHHVSYILLQQINEELK